MKLEKKYALAGIGLLLVMIVLFGCVSPGYLYPSLQLTFSRFWAQNDGIYGHILEAESTSAGEKDSVMAFKLITATDKGAFFPVGASNFETGNGVCNVQLCPAPYNVDSQGRNVYIAFTGYQCAGHPDYKVFSFATPPQGQFHAAIDFTSPLEGNYTYMNTFGREDACRRARDGAGTIYHIMVDATFNGTTQPYCGDHICNGQETTSSCPTDCSVAPFCGDHICNGVETHATCAQDCTNIPVCGDNVCEGTETFATCPVDCTNPNNNHCTDGTAYGACSITQPQKRCVNGVLSSDAACTIPQKGILEQIGEIISQYWLALGLTVVAIVGLIMWKANQ